MISRFLTPSDPLWSEFLADCPHDAYHLPGYLELTGNYEGGEPLAFYAEYGDSRFLAPFLMRPLPQHLNAPPEWRDAITPYGYPTPLLFRGDELALAIFFDALRRESVGLGLITAFFRLHPLLSLPTRVLAHYGERRLHGRTVYLDLCRSDERLWGETRPDHRRQLRKLSRDGYRAQMDDWESFESYMHIYRENMGRLGAAPFYHFPDSYFWQLKEALGPHLHLCTVTAPDGALAAAATFFEVNGMVQYHLGATAGEHLRKAPSKLFLHFTRLWARERGCHTFHLGGGVGANSDSLYEFKRGFATTEAGFSTFRMVLDDERYERLSRLNPTPDVIPGDYFPRYRWAQAGTR